MTVASRPEVRDSAPVDDPPRGPGLSEGVDRYVAAAAVVQATELQNTVEIDRRAKVVGQFARPDRLPPFTWLVFLFVGALVIGGYELVPAGIGADAIYAAVGLGSVAAIVVGARRHRPGVASAWYLMAAGQLLWVVGDFVDSWLTDVDKIEKFPSPADVFYLLAYPVLAVGLGHLIRIHRRGRDAAEVIDGITVTAGLGLLYWVVLGGPTIAGPHHSIAAALITLAYPLGDILLIGLLINLVTTRGGRSASFRLLILALFLLVAGDTASSAFGLFTATATRVFDWLWLASYLAWGAAALHPSMHQLTEPSTDTAIRFGRRRFAAMALATMVAPGTLAVEQLAGRDLTVWPVVIGAVTTFLLVVIRMALTIRSIVTADAQRELLREALAYQAAHDSLTQLPNRAQAMRLLTAALHRAQRSGSVIGVLFVDLDGFKAVNDTYGHPAGDELLRIVARTLLSHVRAGDVVARLGGDEFMVVLEPLDVQDSAVLVADRLVKSLRSPITLSEGREVRIGASIGLAISQDGRVDPDALLQEADVAVYRAKAAGRGRTEVFDDGLRAELAARTELEAAITRAIEEDQLVLHYQPVVHVATGRVDGYEALVRWNHPERGLLYPAEFLPVAETSELVCELDAWALRHAMRQVAEWNDRPRLRRINMGVNVSGRHVARPRILQDVRSALAESGVPARQLVLEVTETVLIDEPVACAHLEELRSQGVLISIDDFGTGYNSISRLESLPVDVVKVDKHFVDLNATSAKLLPLMIQTAHAFGLPVVAEGVETEEQMAILRSLGCELAQGYLIGRPTDAITAGRRYATSPDHLEPAPN
jgi:diguanylate cyclase (GGDEF)-like protein